METTAPRTRNLDASKTRKAIISDLAKEGFLSGTMVSLNATTSGFDSRKDFDLLSLVGVTERELKGVPVATPKPVDKTAVTEALTSGQLSIEDLTDILKAAKKAA